MNHYCFTYL